MFWDMGAGAGVTPDWRGERAQTVNLPHFSSKGERKNTGIRGFTFRPPGLGWPGESPAPAMRLMRALIYMDFYYEREN
jgi:hypothetical protein